MPISTIGQNGLNAPLSLTSPALTTPNLGTPSAINLSNATALARAALPTGCILQVVQAVKTDSYASATGAQWGTIPSLSASITPSASSNKVLVFFDIKFVGDTDASVSRLRMMRNSTAIYIGDAASNRPRISTGQNYWTSAGSGGFNVVTSGGFYLDSPATTSATTYKIQIRGDGATSFQVNAQTNNQSSIVVMEISA